MEKLVFTPVWKFDRSIDFAKNFDRMRCKTKAFCEDLHKNFNKKIYDMFRTLDN